MPSGSITTAPSRHFRLILGMHVFWMVILFFLGGWWARLALKQAGRIAELEKIAGVSIIASQLQWAKTQRMLFWESGTFFLLLLFSTLLLFWLYWRDYTRSRSLHAFFASVTHELRTPLTSIRLQAESIADNAPSDPAQKLLIGRIIEDTMRLESQVESALELARIEGGGPLYVQPLELKPLLTQSLGYWDQAFGERLKTNLEVGDVFVEADPSAIQVVLRNILENAMKHSRRDNVMIRARSKIDGDRVFLEFEDNGQGFQGDPKRLGRLFEKGAYSQGAGVGLFLIRTLMERMGGHAAFTQHDGFRVTLCFRSAPSAEDKNHE